jgi:hypothetical protein
MGAGSEKPEGELTRSEAKSTIIQLLPTPNSQLLSPISHLLQTKSPAIISNGFDQTDRDKVGNQSRSTVAHPR